MKTEPQKTLLSVPLPNESFDSSLEKIFLYIKNPRGIFHIVSLNPEIFALAEKNAKFKRVLVEAQMRIIDGTYVYRVARLLKIPVQSRIQGVDLMKTLLEHASRERLRVMLIGGAAEIAEKVVVRQKQAYPRLEITGTQGIKDVYNPSRLEEESLLSIVADVKPHLIFFAFGSPYQELWIDAHKKQLEGSVVVGVGGAFDFLSGNVPRAPKLIRDFGFEWLFRLVVQPWRIKRQLSVFNFFAAVIKEQLKRN